MISPKIKAEIMHWKHQSSPHPEIKIEAPLSIGKSAVFAALTDFLCWH
jgi:hypothetical protein